MRFEYLQDEATADLAIKAYGNNLKEVFKISALAIMDTLVDIKTISSQEIIFFSKKAKDLKSLFYNFLEEIIFLLDSRGLVFNSIEINDLDEKNFLVNVTLKGEVYDKNKHISRNQIKAITYFGMKITNKQAEFTIDL